MRDGSSKVLSAEGGIFTSVMFTPDGCHVVASNMDRYLRIWDVRSAQLVGKWNEAGIRSVAISPDGEELVSGSWGGAIKSWDISSLKTQPHPGSPADSNERAEGHPGLIQKMEFDGHSVGLLCILLWSFHTFLYREKYQRLPSRPMANGSSAGQLINAFVYGTCVPQCSTAR